MSLQVEEDLMVKMVNNEFGACNTGLLNVGYIVYEACERWFGGGHYKECETSL